MGEVNVAGAKFAGTDFVLRSEEEVMTRERVGE